MPLPDNLIEFDPLAPAPSRNSGQSSTSSLFRSSSADDNVNKYHEEEGYHASNIQTNVAPLEAVRTDSDPLGCDDLLVALDLNRSNRRSSSNSSKQQRHSPDGLPHPQQQQPPQVEDEILSELNFAAQQSWGTKQQHQNTTINTNDHSHNPLKDSPPPRRLSKIMVNLADDLPRSPAVDPTISPGASETYHPAPSRRPSIGDNIAKSVNKHSHPHQHAPDNNNTSTRSPPSSYFPIPRFSTKNSHSSSILSSSSSRSFAAHTRHKSQTENNNPHASSPEISNKSMSSTDNNHSHSHPNPNSTSNSSTAATTPVSYIGNHPRPYTPPSGAPGFAGEDRNWNKSKFEFDVTKDSLSHHIEFTGIKPGIVPILEEDLADAIRPSLPPRVRVSHKWKLLYSLDQDGVSLSTLYSRVAAGMGRKSTSSGCLLVVEDTDGCVFGAYSNEAFKRSDSYYGSGECFLWKSIPFESDDFRVGKSVKAFKWTGRNNYMVLSDMEFISIGGGDGNFGLCIDSDLDEGISTPCPAFRNEILCSHEVTLGENRKQGKFKVLNVEVWGIGL